MGIILFNLNETVVPVVEFDESSFRPLMGIILFNPVFETTGIY